MFFASKNLTEVDSINPLIGITCGHQWEDPERYYVNGTYISAITKAGGVPVLIPYMAEQKLSQILDLLDGLLVPGGIDIDARLFNQELHPRSGKIDPLWDQLDIFMIRGALEKNIPVLAICRGCQILNVACGGSMIQDIESQVANPIKHQQQAPKWYGTHSVTITPQSLLQRIFMSNSLRVNSFHHQSVLEIAPGFQVSALASDGVVEAIESVEHDFVMGVQWHPELMVKPNSDSSQLFTAFILATKGVMEGI